MRRQPNPKEFEENIPAILFSMPVTQRIETGKALTHRENIVLMFMAQGYTKRETAKAMRITYHTVKTHLTNVYDSLGARCAAHAVYLAMKKKIL